MRRYRVRRSANVAADLDLIDDYLDRVYQDLGDDPAAAMERAAARVDQALACLRRFEHHPHRGTEHPEIRPGIRTVTSNRFVFHFEIDEPASEGRILGLLRRRGSSAADRRPPADVIAVRRRPGAGFVRLDEGHGRA